MYTNKITCSATSSQVIKVHLCVFMTVLCFLGKKCRFNQQNICNYYHIRNTCILTKVTDYFIV